MSDPTETRRLNTFHLPETSPFQLPLSPLIQQSTTAMSNVGSRVQTLSNPVDLPSRGGYPDVSEQSFVVDIGDGSNSLYTEVNPGIPHHIHNSGADSQSHDADQPPGGSQNEAAGHHHHGNGPQAGDRAPDWRILMKCFEHSGPFALLLFIKVMYDHRLGILMFAGLLGTFYYSNKKLEQEIYNLVMRDTGSRQRQSRLTLVGIIVFLSANIAALYLALSGQHLYRSLYFQLPEFEKMDVWEAAWIVVLTDYVLKFGGIIIKSCIALMPVSCVPHRKRGKYYMFIEQLVQLYRSLTPIIPWLHFLSDAEHGGQWFAAMLLIGYVACKAYLLWSKSKELREAFTKVRTDMIFGVKPDRSEMKEIGETCPICQDDYREPVKLCCKHIFCEDCVSVWFDREKTCPMCRAHITDNPAWRDGSTSSHIQWY